ncbi:MAG: hypothetical protein FWD71_02850 [Oscillospiraceae bacterium]|nr:hypothetical protein [Oscillospiraceae bacterium]
MKNLNLFIQYIKKSILFSIALIPISISSKNILYFISYLAAIFAITLIDHKLNKSENTDFSKFSIQFIRVSIPLSVGMIFLAGGIFCSTGKSLTDIVLLAPIYGILAGLAGGLMISLVKIIPVYKK